jgi:hypothetical protein
MALLKAIGKESIAILSGEENRGFHCRSILTQIPINGQSRAKTWSKASPPDAFSHTMMRLAMYFEDLHDIYDINLLDVLDELDEAEAALEETH